MPRYLITFKNGNQKYVEADCLEHVLDGTTISRHDVSNVQELGVQKIDHAEGK